MAWAMAAVLFFALAIMGLGALSFFTGREIIAIGGLGLAPGIWGMIAAVAAFGGTLWATLQPELPSYTPVWQTMLATPLAHLFVIWLLVLVSDAGLVVATSVSGDLVRGGASAVLMFVALFAAWCGVALRRTRMRAPRWPWEGDGDTGEEDESA